MEEIFCSILSYCDSLKSSFTASNWVQEKRWVLRAELKMTLTNPNRSFPELKGENATRFYYKK